MSTKEVLEFKIFDKMQRKVVYSIDLVYNIDEIHLYWIIYKNEVYAL